MMARTKWSEIYQILRERIEQGLYKPGQDFPTNLELSKEFSAHPMTIQSAVNTLIREGLVISSSTRKPRKVRPIPHKSTRKSFSNDSTGKQFDKVLLEIKIITDKKEIPEDVLTEMEPPVLFYHHEQWLEGMLAAVSRSYMPNYINLSELEGLLKAEGSGLYRSMRSMGFTPSMCEETLSASSGTDQDNKDLQLPANSSVTIMHILRKVFNTDGRILEYCYLTDRADCYDFSYRFPL
jgi:GntR family transcriptional regulator